MNIIVMKILQTTPLEENNQAKTESERDEDWRSSSSAKIDSKIKLKVKKIDEEGVKITIIITLDLSSYRRPFANRWKSEIYYQKWKRKLQEAKIWIQQEKALHGKHGC